MIQRSEPIVLRTKTTIPSLKPNWLERARLIHLLHQGSAGKLTFLSAPAGFGKTTLLTQWVHQRERAAAWYALDAKDNDPMRFWRYVSYTLAEAASPNVAARILHLTESLPHLSLPTFLDALINELSAELEPLVLILDDYQMITAESIHEHIAYFIEYMPAAVHVILASRSDLPFSAAKWLLLEEYMEIPAQQLQFTQEETKSYYREAVKLPLRPEQAETLFRRTEGWAAGLQLVSLSLRSHADTDSFIEQFAGNHRNVAEYLFHEVLSWLPEPIADFLLITSLLERMDAELCDALRGKEDSRAILETLQNWNLFLVPLDDHQTWFRYHHLFAQFLRSRLERKPPAALQELHRRISECFEHRGFLDEAIEHAIAARDYTQIDKLLARNLPSALQQGEFRSLLRWFDSVPEDCGRTAEMMLLHCFLMLVTGNPVRAESHMRLIEERLDAMEPSERRKQLQSGILFVKSNLVFYSGDYEGWYRFSAGIEERLLPESPLFYGFNYNRQEPFVRRTEFGLKGMLSSDTETIGQQFVRVLESKGWSHTLINLYMNQALGEGYYEWNRLEESRSLIGKVDQTAGSGQTPGLLVPNRLMQARLYLAEGGLQLALDTVEQTITSLVQQQLTETHWLCYVRCFQLRLYLGTGQLAQAKKLAPALQDITSKDKPTFHRQYAYVTLARLLGAQRKEAEALRLLELLKPQAARERSLISLVEISLLQALLEAQRGQRSAAFAYLHEALLAGEANGYARSFLDEGEEAGDLIRKFREHRLHKSPEASSSAPAAADPAANADTGPAPGTMISDAYLDRLLAHFPTIAAPPAAAVSLVEPLTRSEEALVRLLVRGASNKEIAQELSLSLGTVKVYLSRIYAKLGVTSRTQALIAVQELGLLEL